MWRGEPSSSNDWGVVMAYRLRAGDTGPVQQSPVTCGSACLTVARMLVDPLFASWIRTGSPRLPGSPAGEHRGRALRGVRAGRHAPHEQPLRGRAAGRTSRGRTGSAPRRGAPVASSSSARPGAARATRSTCCAPTTRPSSSGPFDTLVDVVAEGEPALLYVGNALSPRHVVLVLPGDGDRMLDVYDPGTGRVDHLRRDTVVRAPARPQRLGRAVDRRAPDGPAHGAHAGLRAGAGRGPRLTGIPARLTGIRTRAPTFPLGGEKVEAGQAVGLATGTSSTSRAPTSSASA